MIEFLCAVVGSANAIQGIIGPIIVFIVITTACVIIKIKICDEIDKKLKKQKEDTNK